MDNPPQGSILTPEEYKRKYDLLMATAAITAKEKELTAGKGFGKAYLISVLFPPMGLYYFVKYVFFSGGDSEYIKAGVISLTLTVGVILLTVWSLMSLLKQASSIIPGGEAQLLKDLTDPKNQKELLDLYR